MRRAPSPNNGGMGVLMGCVAIAAAVLLFAPNLVSAWIGGLIGEVWATAISAVAALLGGLLGGALALP